MAPTIVIVDDNYLLAQDLQEIVAMHMPTAKVVVLADMVSAAGSLVALDRIDLALIGARSARPELALLAQIAAGLGAKIVSLGDATQVIDGGFNIPGPFTNESVSDVMMRLLGLRATVD